MMGLGSSPMTSATSGGVCAEQQAQSRFIGERYFWDVAVDVGPLRDFCWSSDGFSLGF